MRYPTRTDDDRRRLDAILAMLRSEIFEADEAGDDERLVELYGRRRACREKLQKLAVREHHA